MCPDDGLPTQVCQQCVQKVISSYEFKLLCERSDTKLRGCIRSSINIHTPQLPWVSTWIVVHCHCYQNKFNWFKLFIIRFIFILLFRTICFLFCVLCDLYCFSLCIILCFAFCVQVYGPLPPGGNLIAVNKYHIIYHIMMQNIHHWILFLFTFGNINWLRYTIFLICNWNFDAPNLMLIVTAYMKHSSAWEFCIFFLLSKKFPHFMELEDTLIFLEYTRRYLEPYECRSWPETLLLYNPV